MPQGDRQGRGVWLLTNERVVIFYAQLGFRKIGDFAVGDGNPAWKEKPVVMCIVSGAGVSRYRRALKVYAPCSC